jgi:hypothetical protein
MPDIIVSSTTVILGDTDLKALPTTPFKILTGIANKIIKPIYAQLLLDDTAGNYGNLDGTSCKLSLHYGNSNGSNSVASSYINNNWFFFFGNSTPTIMVLSAPLQVDNLGNVISSTIDTDFAIGGDIYLFMDNGVSGNLTGGNVANSLKVTIAYTI